MVIGISGKYCAGKNKLAGLLEKRGFNIIDVDRVGHEALESVRGKVIDRFGRTILDDRGRINRSALGKIVFKDKEALRDLEAIVHPWMVDKIKTLVKQSRDKGPVVINAALLFKMGLHELCDFIFWVDASFFSRIKRARKRDHLSFLQIIRRIFTQLKLTAQHSFLDVDMYKVRNSGGPENLEKQVEAVLKSKNL